MYNINLKLLIIIITILEYYLVICLPCSYHDTVDLSNSKKELNGSYFYDGIEIPSHLVAIYNHGYETYRDKIYAEPHLRGCICKIKMCVKWCCAPNEIYVFANFTCINNHIENFTTEIEMKTKTNENVIRNVNTHFYGLPSRLPCNFVYALRSNTYTEDEWYLYENSSLVLPNRTEVRSRDEYCLAVDNHKGQHNIVPFICSETELIGASLRDIIYACSLFLSVPCMIFTMIIYLWLPELRNLHGKALACYLFGLSVGYSIMGFILLKGSTQITAKTCAIIGFLCYYCFMAAFLWLTVIGFDLWWNFSGRNTHSRYNEHQRFTAYSIYSWGLAGCFLIIAITIQNSDNIDDKYKPAIGGNQFCFLDTNTNWSATIYFYGPIFLVIVFNLLMFILTSIKIHEVQLEMTRMMSKNDSQRITKTEKDNILKSRFGLYLRLFVIMGVTWTIEIITYMIGKDHGFNYLVFICDACNTLQGLLILILFVLKRQVKRLILKEYDRSQGRKMSRQYSRTTSSNIGMVNTSHKLNH